MGFVAIANLWLRMYRIYGAALRIMPLFLLVPSLA
ncbi:unnamed protein product [Arabidopsis halleri]